MCIQLSHACCDVKRTRKMLEDLIDTVQQIDRRDDLIYMRAGDLLVWDFEEIKDKGYTISSNFRIAEEFLFLLEEIKEGMAEKNISFFPKTKNLFSYIEKKLKEEREVFKLQEEKKVSKLVSEISSD